MPKKSEIATIVKAEVIDASSLTLDDIENRMVQIAMCESSDIVVNMINERKMSMLEKVANLKLKRLQLKALENTNTVAEVEPITVKFISANTEEQRSRIERIDDEILKQSKLKQNA